MDGKTKILLRAANPPVSLANNYLFVKSSPCSEQKEKGREEGRKGGRGKRGRRQ